MLQEYLKRRVVQRDSSLYQNLNRDRTQKILEHFSSAREYENYLKIVREISELRKKLKTYTGEQRRGALSSLDNSAFWVAINADPNVASLNERIASIGRTKKLNNVFEVTVQNRIKN